MVKFMIKFLVMVIGFWMNNFYDFCAKKFPGENDLHFFLHFISYDFISIAF